MPVASNTPAPEAPPPVGNLVLNVAESCNLGCTYCFADEGDYSTGATMMEVETAKRSLEFLFRESGEAQRLHVTLFGGEPLMNFSVLREAVTYGEELAAKHGKQLDFTMTTNATLLKPDVTAFFQEHRIGLTVHRLSETLDGDLDEIISALRLAEEEERMEASEA